MTDRIVLDLEDLREVTAFAVENATDVLKIFERFSPSDSRPRDAVDAARAFACGGRRVKTLRDTAWAALRAAKECKDDAASQVARAAMSAASAAWLHPLADPHQVKHILGAAAHAARAVELAAGDIPEVGTEYVERTSHHAIPRVIGVLNRFPLAPSGGGRVGELLRLLDDKLRRVIL
jgi:hypothetical protein